MGSDGPVLPGVPTGTRVVVRYLIEGGDRATDALGMLVERTEDHLVIDTRRGLEPIPLAAVILAKPVPPAPQRRHRSRPR